MALTKKTYAYVRYTDEQRVLVVANFDRKEHGFNVKLPAELLNQWQLEGAVFFSDLLGDKVFNTPDIKNGIGFSIPGASGLVLGF